MCKKLTIIIPTHNRHKYLDRLLSYFSDIDCDILIADSSNEKYIGKIWSHMSYFYYPDAKLIYKFNDIVQKVKTPYMLFCADDDFWVKESLAQCMEFLEDNKDYSSVQGKYIGFEDKKETSFIPAYLHAKSIEDDEIDKRMNACMGNYMPLFYAMHRSEVMKKVFNDNVNTNIEHAILIELSVSLYSLTYGKHKVLDMLTYVRDLDSISTPVKRHNLKVISEKEEFYEEYEQFILNVGNLIHEVDLNLNGEHIVRSSFSLYFKNIHDNKIKNFIKNNFRFLLPIVRYIRGSINRKKVFSQLEDTPGYPISDKSAIDSWHTIKALIEKNYKK